METRSHPSDPSSFVLGVPQIVPESWCRDCRICCRFPADEGVQAPTWSSLEAEWVRKPADSPSWFKKDLVSPSLLPVLQPCGEGCRCPAFEKESNRCSIYPARPLDCRLYPFVLTTDRGGSRVVLSMDTKCPYLQAHGTDPEVATYAVDLASYLETPAGVAYIKTNPRIVGEPWPEFISMAALPSLTAAVHAPASPPHPFLQPLTWDQRGMLQEALALAPHATSAYTLASVWGWSDLLRYWWAKCDGALCLFAEQAGGLFMPLPPFGEAVQPEVLNTVWEILEEANRGSEVSRIEGVEPQQIPLFEKSGFRLISGELEYLYDREKLVRLRGDRYRSQRWAINRFHRLTHYWIRPFQEEDLVACLQLYTLWGIQRQQALEDPFPKALIRDGLFYHRRLMMSHRELGLTGRVLEIEGRIRGYTFGGQVSSEIFCVFLEIADRSIPGLAQTLFRDFCLEMDSYLLINAMGDSGLPGLRQAKRSYRPQDLAQTAIASRPKSDIGYKKPA